MESRNMVLGAKLQGAQGGYAPDANLQSTYAGLGDLFRSLRSVGRKFLAVPDDEDVCSDDIRPSCYLRIPRQCESCP